MTENCKQILHAKCNKQMRDSEREGERESERERQRQSERERCCVGAVAKAQITQRTST